MMETMYGGRVTDVACKLGQIMLRYRPIAPKPAAAGTPVPGDATVARGGRRAKRKVAGREGKRRMKTKRVTPLEEEEEEKNYNSSSTSSSIEAAPPTVVTLPLMPETPERKESPPATPSPTSSGQGVPSPASSDLGMPCFRPTWQQLPGATGKVLAPKPVRPAGTWVTVERVTETWGAAAAGLRCSDEVVRQTLMVDASPSFITDTWDQVTWTNAACRTMVLDEGEAEIVVALETRGRVPPAGTCGAFTCRVTVRYSCRRRGRVLLVAPCDVWRMAGGGLAWRLDVKAALSLGSGPGR